MWEDIWANVQRAMIEEQREGEVLARSSSWVIAEPLGGVEEAATAAPSASSTRWQHPNVAKNYLTTKLAPRQDLALPLGRVKLRGDTYPLKRDV